MTNERKNDIYSTLFVLNTSLMIDSGDTYITTEKMAEGILQKSFLFLPWKTSIEITVAVTKANWTITNITKIFRFCLLGAYMKKMITYVNSIEAPTPLTTTIKILFDVINGRPYYPESKQLRNDIT